MLLSPTTGREIRFMTDATLESEVFCRIAFRSSEADTGINVHKDQFVFGAPITVSSIGNSLSNMCQLPNKSGTIALLSDITSGTGGGTSGSGLTLS